MPFFRHWGQSDHEQSSFAGTAKVMNLAIQLVNPHPVGLPGSNETLLSGLVFEGLPMGVCFHLKGVR